MIAATVCLFITLLYLVFTMDRAWSNVTLPERNELVFEGRHRAYGAYQLRKEYDHRLVVAFASAIGVLLLLAALPKAVAWLTPPIAVPPPLPPLVIVDVSLPPDFRDVPQPIKPRPTAAQSAPRQTTSLVVPVDSVLIPLPDTVHANDLATFTPILGVGNGEKPSSDSGLVAALDKGTDLVNEPWKSFQVDEPPVFPGGKTALGPWVRDHLDFPQDLAGKDVVYVQFTVDQDGRVIDARALSGKQAQCKEAAKQTVARMPRWKPARMNGRDVPCRLTLPIRFEVR